jgi:hypothetical protein
MFKLSFTKISLVILTLSSLLWTPQVTAANKYGVVVVEPFTIAEGVAFTPDWLATLQEEVVQQMQKSGGFKETLRAGEKASNASEPILQLSGVVTEYQAGSRTKRYVLGPMFGKTKIVAHVKFMEPTGKVVLEKDVDGKVIIGFIGGDSIGATRGLAKEIVELAKNKLR